MHHIYILHCADGSYYVGYTANLPRRLQAHTAGSAARHTRDHAPVLLVYSEQFPARTAAVRRERQIKGWTRAKKEGGDVATLRRRSRCRGARPPRQRHAGPNAERGPRGNVERRLSRANSLPGRDLLGSKSCEQRMSGPLFWRHGRFRRTLICLY